MRQSPEINESRSLYEVTQQFIEYRDKVITIQEIAGSTLALEARNADS
jgi:hypothetical protein